MAINLADKASPKVLERFTKRSVTEGLFSTKYDWTGVATVKVYTTDLLALNDYDKTKTDGSRFGVLTEVGDTVQEMTVVDDKAFNGSIDKGNNTAQLQIKAASRILKENTDNVVIPYVDKYRLNKIAASAGTKVGNVSISKSNVIETLMKAKASMMNENVPADNLVCYMGYTKAVELKLADQVVGAEKLAVESIVNGEAGLIDGMHMKFVPDSYLPEGCVFLIVRRGSCCAPAKVQTYRILEEHPDIDGHVVQGRLLHDCFVLETHAKAVYAAYSTAI